jgi:hypothetical protein
MESNAAKEKSTETEESDTTRNQFTGLSGFSLFRRQLQHSGCYSEI